MVGYEDGSVRVWDLKKGNSLHVIKGEERETLGLKDRIITVKNYLFGSSSAILSQMFSNSVTSGDVNHVRMSCCTDYHYINRLNSLV